MSPLCLSDILPEKINFKKKSLFWLTVSKTSVHDGVWGKTIITSGLVGKQRYSFDGRQTGGRGGEMIKHPNITFVSGHPAAVLLSPGLQLLNVAPLVSSPTLW